MINRLVKTLLMLVAMTYVSLAHSQSAIPLPVDEAFSFSAAQQDNFLLLHWQIAPGYHLYKDRINIRLANAKNTILNVTLPPGIIKQDPLLGTYQAYQDEITVKLLIPKQITSATSSLIFLLTYQGCADFGFCYPPIMKQLSYQATSHNIVIASHNSIRTNMLEPIAQQDKITQLLASQHLWLTLISFFGFGLLLTFTPCVLPMIPILSGIIVGQNKQLNTKKAFCLSLAYVLTMAITYAGAGILAGLAGNHLQTTLQNPWVLICFSLLFVLLALSLFGLYELRLPTKLNNAIANASNGRTQGTYLSAILLGFLSTLIVSPCVTAPLVGALSYISQTGNALLGGMALFVLGMGMGTPLLIIGTTEGKFLPKSGPWMDIIKNLFGILMLMVAIWILDRVLPSLISMILWACLAICSGIYLGTLKRLPNGARSMTLGIGFFLLVYGAILIIGASMGNTNPLQPLTNSHQKNPLTHLAFKPIKTYLDLENALTEARRLQKPVLLDFYADWCISCKKMDLYVYGDPRIQSALKSFMLLQVDMTSHDQNSKIFEHRLNIVAPPTVLFFNADAQELKAHRIVGEIDAQQFLEHISKVLSDFSPK